MPATVKTSLERLRFGNDRHPLAGASLLGVIAVDDGIASELSSESRVMLAKVSCGGHGPARAAVTKPRRALRKRGADG